MEQPKFKNSQQLDSDWTTTDCGSSTWDGNSASQTARYYKIYTPNFCLNLVSTFTTTFYFHACMSFVALSGKLGIIRGKSVT